MDVCAVWELNDIIENLPYTDRNLWEANRLTSYILAKANFKGISKFQDLTTFKWEQKDNIEVEHDYDISDDDINRLKNLAKQWEKE